MIINDTVSRTFHFTITRRFGEMTSNGQADRRPLRELERRPDTRLTWRLVDRRLMAYLKPSYRESIIIPGGTIVHRTKSACEVQPRAATLSRSKLRAVWKRRSENSIQAGSVRACSPVAVRPHAFRRSDLDFKPLGKRSAAGQRTATLSHHLTVPDAAHKRPSRESIGLSGTVCEIAVFRI